MYVLTSLFLFTVDLIYIYFLVELETDTKISHCYILTIITYTQNDYY